MKEQNKSEIEIKLKNPETKESPESITEEQEMQRDFALSNEAERATRTSGIDGLKVLKNKGKEALAKSH